MTQTNTNCKIIVITSGKGGVGKTTTTANIGAGLAMKGYKVALIDTDTGLRNLDLLLGLENRIMYDLVDVTSGKIPYKKPLFAIKNMRHYSYCLHLRQKINSPYLLNKLSLYVQK